MQHSVMQRPLCSVPIGGVRTGSAVPKIAFHIPANNVFTFFGFHGAEIARNSSYRVTRVVIVSYLLAYI